MNTNVSDSLSPSEEEQADFTIAHYISLKNLEKPVTRSLRPITRWFGLLSTIAWGMAALSPETFKIPAGPQGWSFLIAIVWFFAYCAGFFNL